MSRLRSAALLACLALAALAFAQAPEKNYDLLHVHWRLSFDLSRGFIDGDVTNEVAPTKSGVTSVWFHCEELTVKRVTVNGTATNHSLKGGILTVPIPRARQADKKWDVRITYSGYPQNGIYFVKARHAFPATTPVVYTQGQAEDTRFYIPTYDLPDDKATSECTVTAPLEWTVITNGPVREVSRQGATKTVHARMDQPHSTYLISLIAGPFSRVVEQWDGIPVEYYVPPGLEMQGRASFAGTDQMVAFFSELTGTRYPYAKFAQTAVADYMYGGMENIAAVTNTIDTLHLPSSKPIHNSSGLVLHELAHMWFGDLVTCVDWTHIWINEGFATFLPNFYNRKFEGEDAYRLGRFGAYRGAQWAVSQGERSKELGDQPTPEAAIGDPYSGGATRMFMLMDMVGEDLFWKGIKNFLAEYGFKNATTPQFFESMSKTTGRDLTPFMRQWFYTRGIPQVRAKLEGRNLTLSQSKPFYALDIPVLTRDGSIKMAELRGEYTQLDVGEAADGIVVVDPAVSIWMDLDDAELMSPAVVERAYRAIPYAGLRARLIEKYFGSLSEEQRLGLARFTENSELMSRAVSTLGEGSQAALLEFTSHKDARVANAAINRLGAFSLSAAAAAKLSNIWQNHTSEPLRNSALRVLLERTEDDALADRAWKRSSFDDSFRMTVLRWWGRMRQDKAREAALAALVKPETENLRVVAIEVLGQVKDKPGEKRAYDALVGVLGELTFSARNNALRALGSYGDPAAIPHLKKYVGRGSYFLRETAAASVRRLEEAAKKAA